ncbi:hypothetical protein H9X96_20405 [Pedobacter sp. N36a]|uniref:hypothetical protein n=1 Tax=Pedobacter sp. N36a TaxID=2767996 RepID=UPI00165698B1|nr:hypothetical protein [Pedobacter sp. N36a]MBC8988123.1 hypothetical protein [Pedobacter sp. N36a]
MRRSKKQIQFRLKQGVSLLMVLLFLCIAAAPILHEHTAVDSRHQENNNPEPNSRQEQLQLSDKCSVCDYYHHIQGKQIFSHYLMELPSVFSKLISTIPHRFTRNYKITVQGFTNKGPPQTA